MLLLRRKSQTSKQQPSKNNKPQSSKLLRWRLFALLKTTTQTTAFFFFSLLHKRTYIYVIIIAIDSVPHQSDEILPTTYLYVVSHPTLNFQKRIYTWLSTESVKHFELSYIHYQTISVCTVTVLLFQISVFTVEERSLVKTFKIFYCFKLGIAVFNQINSFGLWTWFEVFCEHS